MRLADPNHKLLSNYYLYTLPHLRITPSCRLTVSSPSHSMSVPAVFPVQSEFRNIELGINETPGKKVLRDQEQYRKDGKEDAHWPLKEY